MKRTIVTFALVYVLAGGAAYSAHAETTTASLVELINQLKQQIQNLQAQIEAVKKAQVQVKEASQDVKETLKLIKELREGMSGEDIKLLQTVLAGDADIYPESIISGYFGRLTAKAVQKFQKKHGLQQIGKVGPKTIEKINEFLKKNPVAEEGDDDDEDEDEKKAKKQKERIQVEKKLCAIIPPGHLIAPGWLRKQNGQVLIVPPCQKLPPGIEKKLPGTGTTTPPVADTTVPVISSVASTSVTSSGATITWFTNESSTSKVYFGTTSPLNLATASIASDGSLVLSHSVALSGLSASTTYYYLVQSADAANNSATSSEYLFTTLGGL